jgi:hypothetical protein
MADDLDALGLFQIHALDQEEAPFHPLPGHAPLGASRDFLGANQAIQTFQVRIGLG